MKRKIWAVVILVAAVCAVYANTIRAPFIWDDEALILKNPNIRSLDGVAQGFHEDFYPGSVSGSNFYRPLQTLSYAWDYHWARLTPAMYHCTSILLHALACVLAFFVLLSLSRNFGFAFWTALLYAVHPIHAEAVTYISGRAEPLMAIGIFSALLFIMAGIRMQDGRKWLCLLASLTCFTFALLSKELAMVFPAVAVAYYFVLHRQMLAKKWFVTTWVMPFVAVVCLYLIFRMQLASVLGIKHHSLESVPFITRLSMFPNIVLSYLGILVAPVGLHMSREMMRPHTFSGIIASWGSLVALGIVFVRSLQGMAQRAVVWFLFWWALLFFLPQSGIFPINAFIAEHFIYLSSILFFAAVVYILRKDRSRNTGTVILAGLCLYFGSLTVARNYDWQDPGVFYSKILQSSPASFQAHNNLGLYFQRKGDVPQALAHYRMALDIKPDAVEARSNLAYLYMETGNLEEAQKQYVMEIKTAPHSALGELHNNLGTVLERQGKLNEALSEYLLALKIDPTMKFTRYNVARIYYAQKDTARAVEEIFSIVKPSVVPGERQKAKETLESYVRKYGCLGVAAIFFNDAGVRFADAGLFSAAMEFFTLAVELQPKYVDAQFNKGLIFLKQGMKKDAAFQMRQVMSLDKRHVAAQEILRRLTGL